MEEEDIRDPEQGLEEHIENFSSKSEFSQKHNDNSSHKNFDQNCLICSLVNFYQNFLINSEFLFELLVLSFAFLVFFKRKFFVFFFPQSFYSRAPPKTVKIS